MTTHNIAFAKNAFKLTLIAIAALSSTLGLRTELAIILNDIFAATWISIGWMFLIIGVLAHYKADQDVELNELRYYRENRRMLLGASLGTTLDKPDNQVLLNETK
jgi:hypothetical protein